MLCKSSWNLNDTWAPVIIRTSGVVCTACTLCEWVHCMMSCWMTTFFCSTCFYIVFVSFWKFFFFFCWNGGFEGAVCLHQVLFHTWQEWQKYLVIMLWVRHKPKTHLTDSKMDENQLMITKVLDVLQSSQCWKLLNKLNKVHVAIIEDCWWMIHDICNIVGQSYGTYQCILVDELSMLSGLFWELFQYS